MDSDLPTSPAPRQRLFSWDLWLVFSGVIAARAWLLFSTPFMPGMNGAYYLVQARALIERGSLGIPDLPLTFVLHSLLARVIHLISGLSWDTSILYAVKAADSILPALIVFPIAWTVRGFGGLSSVVPRWLPPLAALALGASAPLLGMVGDFEKNSLGLGWLAFLVWRLAAWIEQPTARNVGWAILWLGLIGITHIGVFGTCILLTASIVSVALLLGRGLPRMSWGLIAGGGLIMALAALVVFGFFDPSRVQKLLAAFAHPLDFLHGANRPGPGPAGGGMPRPPGGGMPPGMPGRGGPLSAVFGTWERFVPYAAIGGLAIVLAGLKRRSLTAAQIATAVGCAVTMILMTGPWVQGDKVVRFNLMVMPPAVLCAAFVLAQVRQAGAQGIFTGMALLAMLNTSYPRLIQGGQPILAPEALAELAGLRDTPLKPDRTLISAQHGVEWWTAWFLHTRIVQPQALKVADWSNYDFVWFLQVKSGMQGPMGMGGQRPPGNDRNGRPPMGRERPPGMQGGAGPGGPMMGPGIPEGSEVFHDGEHFRLAWVQSPPDSLATAPPPVSLAPP